VNPAGNVAALREKNPPPRKSHATRLAQRQTQRRDRFWLFDRLLFSTDPDFENFVSLARMLHPFSPLYCSFINFASRFHSDPEKQKQPSPFELGCLLIVVSV
jgi:hypothetical protein